MSVLWAAMLRVQICICVLSYFGEWLSSKCKTCLVGEKRSAHQLWLKAVDRLWSSTQLVKSHRDDLDQEYLWNGDEYSSLENSLKTMEKNTEYGGQRETLAIVHVMGRPITVHYETQTKALYLEKFYCIDILYQSRRTWWQRKANKSWALRVT